VEVKTPYHAGPVLKCSVFRWPSFNDEVFNASRGIELLAK
jgi:hypothetical protein